MRSTHDIQSEAKPQLGLAGHGIAGDKALVKSIHDSVSAQIKKSFIKSKCRCLQLKGAAPRVRTGGAEQDPLANCTYRCHPTSCI
ncbi:hypothetical protein J4Q44_G00332990 [Coregonus suidteri]|uniref:Uncharacterized protein n=1 Tax=Coregonus suidteri TaxID=861788 RepID=A0AAN8KZI8_9TELE